MYAMPAGYESDETELDFQMQRLKVTRLQDITTGAGLNGEDFDATLNHELQNFLDDFRCRWNAARRMPQPQLQQSFKGVLLKSDSPLLLALKMFANCPDCMNVKNKQSLSFFVLDATCKIYRQQPAIGEKCDDNTRMIAFNFIKTTGLLSLNKAMIETYQLQKIRSLLLTKLREMQDNGHFKDAVQWAIHLELTHEFDMLDLAFPLIAQERVTLAEEYLDIAPHQRLPMVKFLDSLLHRDKSVMELCEPILDRYKHVNASLNILSYRPMSKLVARLAKKYKFDESVIPNYKFTKTCSYLHYLYRDYQKGNMNVAAYRELVHDNATSEALKQDIVTYIATNGDHQEAFLWYKTFKLPENKCPPEIRNLLETDSTEVSSTNENTTATANKSGMQQDEYLTLDLDMASIIIVNTNKEFQKMLDYLSHEQIIYFDCEWKQYVCNKNQLCLLQIADTERVYLIDCLSSELDAGLWSSLGANVFNNMNILKIGFSMQQDLIMLQSSLPLQLKLQSSNQYLDLRCLWQNLKQQTVAIHLPYGSIKRAGEALSDLTALCLGKKLNKSNQCSNWANRPLRCDQILYAALDARCLMLVYNVLTNALTQSGLNLNSVIDVVIASTDTNFAKRFGNAK